MPQDDTYTAREASGILGISYGAITRMIREGKVSAFKLNNKTWHISRPDVDKLSQMQERAQGSYTTHEAASALGVSYYTVSRLIKRGKVEAFQLRHVWYIARDEVERVKRDRKR